MDKTTKLLRRINSKFWLDEAKIMLINAWKHSDKDILITIQEHKETRRTAQNKLLFLWHGELSKHIEESTGDIFSTDDIHEYVAENLLPKNVVTIGQSIIVRTKTSKLNTKEFSEFLSRYHRWAEQKYKCLFSLPDDLYFKAVGEDNETGHL